MTIRPYQGAYGGLTLQARATTDHASSSYGLAVLVVEDVPGNGLEEAWGADDAGRFRVVAGTDEELADLSAAGYRFDDERA